MSDAIGASHSNSDAPPTTEIINATHGILQIIQTQWSVNPQVSPDWEHPAFDQYLSGAELGSASDAAIELGTWLLTNYSAYCIPIEGSTYSLAAMVYLATAHITYWPRSTPLMGNVAWTQLRDLMATIEHRQQIPEFKQHSIAAHCWAQPQRVAAILHRWEAYIQRCSALLAEWSWANTESSQTWVAHGLETTTRHAVTLTCIHQQISQRRRRSMSTARIRPWLDSRLLAFFRVNPALQFRVDWRNLLYQQRLGLGLKWAYRQQNPLIGSNTPLDTIVQSLVPYVQLTELLQPTFEDTPANIYGRTDFGCDTTLGVMGRELMILTAWSHLFYDQFQFFWLDRYYVPSCDFLDWTFAKYTPDGMRRSRPCVSRLMGHWWVWVNEDYYCHCPTVTDAIAVWIAIVCKAHRGQLETDQSLADWMSEISSPTSN
jgi:hypothetical protein